MSYLDHHEWSPALTISKFLWMIWSLLETPDVTFDRFSPVHVNATQLFRNNRAQFEQTARAWTIQHALTQP